MFLTGLSHNQKNAYMSIESYMISSDGRLDNQEMLMMEQYKVEMDLSDQDLSSLPLDVALHEFADSPTVVKKRILFELLGLAFSDGDFAEQETEMIENIRKSLGLETTYVQECSDTVRELLAVYKRIEAVVNG